MDYNTEFNPRALYAPDAFRSSDHDPVLLGLDLPGGRDCRNRPGRLARGPRPAVWNAPCGKWLSEPKRREREEEPPVATIEVTEKNFNEIADEGIVPAGLLGPVVRTVPHLRAGLREGVREHPDIKFGKIDTEAEQALAQGFEITSIPTIMAIRDGIVASPRPGALPSPLLRTSSAQVRALDMELDPQGDRRRHRRGSRGPGGRPPPLTPAAGHDHRTLGRRHRLRRVIIGGRNRAGAGRARQTGVGALPSRGGPPPPFRLGRSAGAVHLGDEERQVERLPAVQPRVAGRLVALVQVVLDDLWPPPTHSVTSSPVSSMWMPPGMRAEVAVHLEEARRPRRGRRRSGGSCDRSPPRRCCRASGRRPTRPGAPVAVTFSTSGGKRVADLARRPSG